MRQLMAGELHPLFKRDLTVLERQAFEVLQQCAHLRRNGAGDEIRFGFIENGAYDMFMLARRAFRRHERFYDGNLL